MEERLQAAVKKLQDHPASKGLFQLTVGEGGLIVPVRESGKPSIVKARLEEILLKIAAEISDKYKIDVTIPYTDEGTISLSTKVWYEIGFAFVNLISHVCGMLLGVNMYNTMSLSMLGLKWSRQLTSQRFYFI